MNIHLNSDLFESYGITDAEIWYLIGRICKFSTEDAVQSLIKKGLVTQNGLLFTEVTVTRKAQDLIEQLVLDSEPKSSDIRIRCNALALQMRELFPEGNKQAGYPWRSNGKEVSTKLQKFFKKYGTKTYTDDQILDATKRYVNSFNGGYTYMRVLKYFIMKDDVSDLASYIENDTQTTSKDWEVELK